MNRFIPYEKLSKKKKKERNAEKRNTWTISPVTRRPENPKAYSRKKAQNWKDDLSDSVSYSSLLNVYRPFANRRLSAISSWPI